MTKTILTIDDSKTIRQMVIHTLKEAGYNVMEADGGLSGLKLLESTQVDLIITDLNMPDLDGFGVIEKVRAGGNHAYTPILMLTTESDAEKKERGKTLGATGWIIKPFSPEKLVQVANKICPL